MGQADGEPQFSGLTDNEQLAQYGNDLGGTPRETSQIPEEPKSVEDFQAADLVAEAEWLAKTGEPLGDLGGQIVEAAKRKFGDSNSGRSKSGDL